MPLRWVNRDGRLLVAARFFRAFAHGSIGVLLAIYLVDLREVSLVHSGLFLSLGLAGGAFFTFFVGLAGDALGRRRLMVYFSLATAAVGVVLVLTDNVPLLLLTAFLGVFSTGGPGGDPVLPLESACLSETCPPQRRTDLFAIAGIVRSAGTALGALAAGLPPICQRAFGLSELAAYQVMILGYALFTALAAILYGLLTRSVEVGSASRWVNPMRLQSSRVIFKLSALFGLDNFASGLVPGTLVSLWFFEHFNIKLGSLAGIFFASHIITAVSLWVAAKLANRIGLVNTMVFTHIPSNLLLIALPFMPYGWLAVIVWQVRAFFQQMDSPTRDSYTMAVVPSEERTAMAVYNNVSRTVASAPSPYIAGAIWSIGLASVPFIACGALRIIYDLTLYVMFRSLKPPEEAQESPEVAQKKQE